MRLRVLALTCTASLLGISAAAYAQEERQTGVYAGASFGQATMDFGEDALPINQPTASKTIDAKGNAGKLFAGYRFDSNFALEAGYTRFGQFSHARTTAAGDTVSASIRASGIFLDMVGIIPLGDSSLFGRLGTMYSSTKTTLSTSGAIVFPAGTNTSPTRRETNLHYGVGVDYSIARHIGARFEYDRARKVGDANPGEADISIWAVGLMLKF